MPAHQLDSHLRQRLLLRIHRQYQTVTQSVRLLGHEFPFTRIASPDLVLDQVAQEQDFQQKLTGRRADEGELHLPYWATLWDSALGVGQLVLRRYANPDSQRNLPSLPLVLDLGCGMGLAGTAAAMAGGHVTFADLEPPALLFARYNALAIAEPAHVHTRQLNWRTTQLGQRFDLILGADILYERREWEFLDAFWRTHLRPGGSILLGEPGRQTGERFVDWIAARPWKFSQLSESIETRPQPIRLFELTHASS